MSTLPTIPPHQQWCCGDRGCGPTTPVPSMHEYSRTEHQNGDVESMQQRVYVSACCRGDLLLWDEEKQDFLDWEYVEASAARQEAKAKSEAANRYEDRPERSVVCAANRYGDLIFVGVRHFCPVMQFNMRSHDIPALRRERGEEQGFIDQHGVFMTRREAALVAKASGQLDRYNGFVPEVLFSEDLY